MDLDEVVPGGGEEGGAVLAADAFGVVAGALGGHAQEVAAAGVELVHQFGHLVRLLADFFFRVEEISLDCVIGNYVSDDYARALVQEAFLVDAVQRAEGGGHNLGSVACGHLQADCGGGVVLFEVLAEGVGLDEGADLVGQRVFLAQFVGADAGEV